MRKLLLAGAAALALAGCHKEKAAENLAENYGAVAENVEAPAAAENAAEQPAPENPANAAGNSGNAQSETSTAEINEAADNAM